MSLVVSAKSQGADFQPHPSGVYPARCTRIIDLGRQEANFKGQAKLVHKILFAFESSEPMPDGEKKGEPFLITTRYTASLSDKAILRKDLESWRGRKFSSAELEAFDLKAVLGKPCLLNMIHNDEGGKTYANISSIMPLAASMTAPQARGELLFLSLAAFDKSVFDKLSDKLKETIAKSPEYQAILAGKPAGQGSMSDMDDDIPF